MARPTLRAVAVEEIVQTDVSTVQGDTPVSTVVAKMAQDDVGSVVVMDEERPVGILTDRKVALSLQETPDLSERTAQDYVHGELVTGDTEMSVFDAIKLMRESAIRRLPIVSKDGTLEGIVTLDDVLILLASELQAATEIIESQLSSH